MSGLRVWILTVHSPITGLATNPVGVAGVDDIGHGWVSWLQPGWAAASNDGWRWRLPFQGDGPVERVLDAVADVNQITADTVEVAPGGAVDVAGAVEAVVDELFIAGGAW